MPVIAPSRRRVELVLVPIMAAVCMAFIIGAIVLDTNAGSCPSPNWHNKVTLTLAGSHAPEASAITSCAGTDCIPPAPAQAEKSAAGSGSLTHQPNGSWVLTTGAAPPSVVTFSIFDAAGKLLAQQSNSLNWTRVGGSERCGGPMAGMQLNLHVS